MQKPGSVPFNTDLMMILRVNEIEHLVLFGLVTSGVTNQCHGIRPRWRPWRNHQLLFTQPCALPPLAPRREVHLTLSPNFLLSITLFLPL
jgi:hypothetical protein